jgi:hypothetical protein
MSITVKFACVRYLATRQPLRRGTVAQLGPPSLAVPSNSQPSRAPGCASSLRINGQPIAESGTFARLVQHESAWPASVPEHRYRNLALAGPCVKGPRKRGAVPFPRFFTRTVRVNWMSAPAESLGSTRSLLPLCRQNRTPAGGRTTEIRRGTSHSIGDFTGPVVGFFCLGIVTDLTPSGRVGRPVCRRRQFWAAQPVTFEHVVSPSAVIGRRLLLPEYDASAGIRTKWKTCPRI